MATHLAAKCRIHPRLVPVASRLEEGQHVRIDAEGNRDFLLGYDPSCLGEHVIGELHIIGIARDLQGDLLVRGCVDARPVNPPTTWALGAFPTAGSLSARGTLCNVALLSHWPSESGKCDEGRSRGSPSPLQSQTKTSPRPRRLRSSFESPYANRLRSNRHYLLWCDG